MKGMMNKKMKSGMDDMMGSMPKKGKKGKKSMKGLRQFGKKKANLAPEGD